MWKVIGYQEPDGKIHHGHDGYHHCGQMHGPLPRKLWVGPHIEKRRKVKAYVAPEPRDRDSANKRDKRHAIEYARWLAQRDGIELPTRGEIRVDWSSVESKTRMHGSKRWDGTVRRRPVQERRIRAVQWGHEKSVYSTPKRGRGAFLYNDWIVDCEIVLPNWDFNPDVPVDESITDAIAIAA